jgi:sec-independent protein translocase protein TatA
MYIHEPKNFNRHKWHKKGGAKIMFGLGHTELLVILVLVLIIFGAGKLPQVGGALGKGLRNFKKGINDADDEIEEGKIEEIPEEKKSAEKEKE